MDARMFLQTYLEQEFERLYGVKDKGYINSVVDDWMDDLGDFRWRYAVFAEYLPGARKLLDVGAGCGTCVFYGLMNGYDAYGIDPEEDKHDFVALKAEEYGYPGDWLDHFFKGVGERLPFPDDSFDLVTTYQTLEHVQDPYRAIEQMIRVTRPGGGIFIACPDYRSFYEAHYLLPWLPLLPRPLARAYLRLLGRPTLGLDNLKYTTKPRVLKWIKKAGTELNSELFIVDINRQSFLEALRRRGLPMLRWLFPTYRGLQLLRGLFTSEISVNLFIKVVSKNEAGFQAKPGAGL